jgi:hypothetical protein
MDAWADRDSLASSSSSLPGGTCGRRTMRTAVGPGLAHRARRSPCQKPAVTPVVKKSGWVIVDTTDPVPSMRLLSARSPVLPTTPPRRFSTLPRHSPAARVSSLPHYPSHGTSVTAHVISKALRRLSCIWKECSSRSEDRCGLATSQSEGAHHVQRPHPFPLRTEIQRCLPLQPALLGPQETISDAATFTCC